MVVPMRRSLGMLLLAALVPMHAQADPAVVLVATRTMLLKDRALYPGARKITVNVRTRLAAPENRVVLPPAGSEGDPTPAGVSGGGAVLEIYDSSGSGERVTIPLPADRWGRDGDPAGSFRYQFSGDAPIWKVYLKNDKISIRGGKAAFGYTLDELAQGSIAVRLTLGTGITWCTNALPRTSGSPPSSANYDRPGRFVSLNPILPVSCPALP
jgi:hypothetical protein